VTRLRTAARATAIALPLIFGGKCANADNLVVPMPRIVIYPGDVISDQMLADAAAGPLDAPAGVAVRDRSSVVGKMAVRTLLPGRAIPLSAVNNPRLVRNGGKVTLTYVEGGVTIATTGDAMQDGSVGQMVKVRNSDSGVTVSGVVQQDGAVRVGGG
jgi:flagella basal body P-ring formation protein FlgA